MEIEGGDQKCTVPTVALDQYDRACIREVLIMYASVLRLMPSSERTGPLLETIWRLGRKLSVMTVIRESESLEIDLLENHVLQKAFTFYLYVVPLISQDPAQERMVLSGIRYLQAYLRGEPMGLPEEDVLRERALE
jgi:hypothetical protein